MTATASPAATYLADLDAALVGPRRVRRGLVQEAADHLEDAAAAYADAGYDLDEAETMAVGDFGTVDEIAPAFQTTLAVAASRRTAWLLLAVVGVQPFVWDGGLLGAHETGQAAGSPVYRVFDQGIEALGGLMVLGALVALVATGIGNRWFHAGVPIARWTGRLGQVSAVLLPASALIMGALSPTGTTPYLLLVTTLVVVLPMALAGHAARRTLQAC